MLHTDTPVGCRSTRKPESAWTVRRDAHGSNASEHAAISYWMNRLQGLPDEVPLIVSLNQTELIDPERVLADAPTSIRCSRRKRSWRRRGSSDINRQVAPGVLGRCLVGLGFPRRRHAVRSTVRVIEHLTMQHGMSNGLKTSTAPARSGTDASGPKTHDFRYRLWFSLIDVDQLE